MKTIVHNKTNALGLSSVAMPSLLILEHQPERSALIRPSGIV